MDIQSLVRNGINTEIRELNETIQVQNIKLKYDGYGDRKEAESAIHQFNFTISTLTHLTYSPLLKPGDSGILAKLAYKIAGLTSSLHNGQCPVHHSFTPRIFVFLHARYL